MPRLRTLAAALAALPALALAPNAAAFCGFYVSGADAKLFADATVVVMMREGTRTVLSMQNNYQGPPSAFAMVVPVPVVLQKENVKTLDDAVFAKIDRLAAPRLVEYWEQDPCKQTAWEREREMDMVRKSAPAGAVEGSVKIEAQFKVGEYDIVILSASDSGGLDKWLRGNKYNIPDGAEGVLKPYVQAGTKFFVAKVDPDKVKFVNGEAKLSPLRFYYDSDKFDLPIRLGLLNAKGPQDLIVHILAPGQRYEVANYPNVTIPTNIDVTDAVRARFGEFYAALLDRTLETTPKAVVTEYAWDAGSCDPCPGPTLDAEDLLTLGADMLPSKATWGYVLTRLHARYTKESLGEDLVFKAAPPIAGGREVRPNGKLEERSQPASVNNFQGRYIIRHKFKGEVTCDNPRWGRWGGPNGAEKPSTSAVKDTASAPRGKVQLASLVAVDIPEIKLTAAAAKAPEGGAKPAPADKTGAPAGQGAAPPKAGAAPNTKSSGCDAGGSAGGALPWLAALAVLGLLAWRARRRAVAVGLLAAAALVGQAPAAEAFCGFYVGGAGAKLFNDATQVVMLREGTRTVLSMRNSYKGPAQDFAMVVPVPVVLQKDDVKTLSNDVFDRIDQLAAPRLVEYWEIDPCKSWPPPQPKYSARKSAGGRPGVADDFGGKVKVEAQFKVGEYEIVILSASEATALDRWLRAHRYNIPEGAEAVLKPYVQAGTKFFVAKVDVEEVTFSARGEAMLSPLRFHYDTDTFSLPVRLGLLNSRGPQDLIVHVLAPGQRYEVANYKNVTIPTNIEVSEDAKKRFGEFYAALFDRTIEENPGAVVTEYAWISNKCDPCPGPTLSAADLRTLGGDVVRAGSPGQYVLTRLHARYTKASLGEDLVFKAAPPIVGGREHYVVAQKLEKRSTPASINNFQGRYIIRHRWKGRISCTNPVRNRWGGPPGNENAMWGGGGGRRGGPPAAAARNLASAPRGNVKLSQIVREPIPELKLKPAKR